MLIMNTNTEKFLVVQANELVEAIYSPALTARAHKVSRLIFSLISPSDTDLKLYQISIETLKSFLGYHQGSVYGRFQQDLRDIAERLNKEPIVIKAQNKMTTAFLIAAYQIDWRTGVVTFEIPQLLKPYLIELKRNFTMYPLLYIPKMRSTYSIRLYELLCQYKTIGYRTFVLEDLQQKVGSDYKLYGDFKRKVLAIAKRDMDEFTDITFQFKEVKESRKVIAINFTILDNARGVPKNSTDAPPAVLTFPPEISPMPADLQQEYLAAGVVQGVLENSWKIGFDMINDQDKADAALRRCGDRATYFREKLALLRASKGAATANPAGFLMKALHEDWRTPTQQTKEDTKQLAKQRLEAKNRLKAIESTRTAWRQRKETRKKELYESLMSDENLMAQAYQNAFDGVGESLRASYFPVGMSVRQIFDTNGLAKNLIALQIEQLRPDLFAEMNQLYKEKMRDLEDEEQLLRYVITG